LDYNLWAPFILYWTWWWLTHLSSDFTHFQTLIITWNFQIQQILAINDLIENCKVLIVQGSVRVSPYFSCHFTAIRQFTARHAGTLLADFVLWKVGNYHTLWVQEVTYSGVLKWTPYSIAQWCVWEGSVACWNETRHLQQVGMNDGNDLPPTHQFAWAISGLWPEIPIWSREILKTSWSCFISIDISWISASVQFAWRLKLQPFKCHLHGSGKDNNLTSWGQQVG